MRSIFYDFVNGHRIDRAQRALTLEPEKTVIEIALDVGFNRNRLATPLSGATLECPPPPPPIPANHGIRSRRRVLSGRTGRPHELKAVASCLDEPQHVLR